MGRSGTDSASGRKLTGHLTSDHFADPDRNLFYDPDAISSNPPVSGYGRCTGWEEKGKKQSLILPDADRITATRVGMGNLVGVVAAISAGGAGAVFWMWADCTDRFIHCFYRGNTGTDIQRKGSFMTEATEAVRHIISTPMWRKNRRKKEKRLLFPCCLQFQVWSAGAVQSGDQQFSCFFF